MRYFKMQWNFSYEIKINTSIHIAIRFQKSHILPDFDDEFYMMIHDWMRNSSFEILTKIRYEMIRYITLKQSIANILWSTEPLHKISF